MKTFRRLSSVLKESNVDVVFNAIRGRARQKLSVLLGDHLKHGTKGDPKKNVWLLHNDNDTYFGSSINDPRNHKETLRGEGTPERAKTSNLHPASIPNGSPASSSSEARFASRPKLPNVSESCGQMTLSGKRPYRILRPGLHGAVDPNLAGDGRRSVPRSFSGGNETPQSMVSPPSPLKDSVANPLSSPKRPQGFLRPQDFKRDSSAKP